MGDWVTSLITLTQISIPLMFGASCSRISQDKLPTKGQVFLEEVALVLTINTVNTGANRTIPSHVGNLCLLQQLVLGGASHMALRFSQPQPQPIGETHPFGTLIVVRAALNLCVPEVLLIEL
jgi:hypothetical protein